MKSKRQRRPIICVIRKSTSPATLIGRMGLADEVAELMRQAYRIGLNNGRLPVPGSAGDASGGEKHADVP